ncbi:hypothetical protein [Marilutibacter maris]|uniref:hypothetical protein n=1 Tax=Marilutibacter maris TaxID=1605891 RepID=UPI0011AE30FE|nr:hypothetical protein [Lysobacter maris]
MKKALFGSALLALALGYSAASEAGYIFLTAMWNGPTEEIARQATYNDLYVQCVVLRNGSLVNIEISAQPTTNGDWQAFGSAGCITNP